MFYFSIIGLTPYGSTYPRLNLPHTGGKLGQETTFLESHILKAVYFISKVIIPKDAPHPEICSYLSWTCYCHVPTLNTP